MSLSTLGRVKNFALYSRVLVLLLQAFFNFLMPDHDAGAFSPPIQHKAKPLDMLLEPLLGGLRRWDGVYFIHVAEHGYTYENTLAFFPLFPMSVRLLANTLLYPLNFVANYTNVLTLSACLLNLVLFINAAETLHELSSCILKNEAAAFKATLLFCINPASIFFTAAYSETMFAFFTFRGLLGLHRKQYGGTVTWLALSCLTRSNGLVNIGFILYAGVKEFQRLVTRCFVSHDRKVNTVLAMFPWILKVAGRMSMQVSVCLSGFILYQYYAYQLYCGAATSPTELSAHVARYGRERGYKMPYTEPSPWCNQTLPLSYAYVQNEHWDVGFLRYFEFKQIPNFVLAAPMVFLCVFSAVFYIKNNFIYSATLGFYEPARHAYKKTDEAAISHVPGYLGHDVFVYIVHLLFLASFAVLMMHVQVTTRFIASSSPVIYWCIATVTTPKEKLNTVTIATDRPGGDNSDSLSNDTVGMVTDSDSNQNKVASSRMDTAWADLDELFDWDGCTFSHRSIFVYFHLYFFVGSAAFPNFLPWT